MTRRRAARRGGRPYQPLPPRRSHWVARLLILAVGLFLLLGALAFAIGR
ncbi:MAG: hypothetical protein ABJB65_06185 [Chloroflexota bacterium]